MRTFHPQKNKNPALVLTNNCGVFFRRPPRPPDFNVACEKKTKFRDPKVTQPPQSLTRKQRPTLKSGVSKGGETRFLILNLKKSAARADQHLCGKNGWRKQKGPDCPENPDLVTHFFAVLRSGKKACCFVNRSIFFMGKNTAKMKDLTRKIIAFCPEQGSDCPEDSDSDIHIFAVLK